MVMITATDTDTDTDTDTALVTVLVLVGRILYITIPTCTVNWISQISNNNGFTAATTLPYLMDPELRSFSAATMSVRCSCFRRGLLRFSFGCSRMYGTSTVRCLALAPQYPYGTSISSGSILYLNWDPSAIVDTFALLY